MIKAAERKKLEEETKTHCIADFMAVTSVEDETEAEFYLDETEFDLEKAVENYFKDPHRHLQQQRQQEQHRRVRQIMRMSKKSDKDFLWMPTRNSEPQQFSLKEPLGRIPGGLVFCDQMGEYFKDINFEKLSIEGALVKSLKAGRPLLVFAYSCQLRTSLQKLFSPSLVEYINSNFISLGLVKGDADYKRAIEEHVRPYDYSKFVVMRVNMFDEIVFMNEWNFEEDKSTDDSLLAVLRNAVKSSAEDRQEEAEVLKNYKPQDFAHFHEEQEESEEMEIEPGVDYEEERILREIQEQEFRESEAAHLRKLSEQAEVQKAQEIDQERQEERKIRKMSLAPEPEVGKDTIAISFRAPVSGRMTRNFEKEDTVEYVFNFVELCDEIVMQDNDKRHFDLLTMAPAVSLMDKKHMKLKQVFEDSEQETLLIKEL